MNLPLAIALIATLSLPQCSIRMPPPEGFKYEQCGHETILVPVEKEAAC
jgi:hypothetical protein